MNHDTINSMQIQELRRELIRSTRENDRIKKELSRTQSALSAFNQGQQQLNLTIQQVGELAEYSGYNINYSDIGEDEREHFVCIADGPRGGVLDDDGKATHYAHIMWFEEIPEEGCIGLGEQLQEPPPVRLYNPIHLKRKLFQFDSYLAWADTAKNLYANCGVHYHNIIALDANGIVCRAGNQFMAATVKKSYPITVYELEG
ncbi:hypothetical protein HCH_02854 [Hahella chejuensis KCTC 2396]|uniref:Uncharacterized protein n=1 Tax=Hahella chejuensis (strain KCTC 2396) TaxID=349521 RepID=Q2SI93_HAHCH|nr:hypothetical protein [Hahella chejuensis]ABC29631.1 hypothetical protein HCH_02854 [Hahella chejuensis KCTC 2396]